MIVCPASALNDYTQCVFVNANGTLRNEQRTKSLITSIEMPSLRIFDAFQFQKKKLTQMHPRMVYLYGRIIAERGEKKGELHKLNHST